MSPVPRSPRGRAKTYCIGAAAPAASALPADNVELTRVSPVRVLMTVTRSLQGAAAAALPVFVSCHVMVTAAPDWKAVGVAARFATCKSGELAIVALTEME